MVGPSEEYIIAVMSELSRLQKVGMLDDDKDAIIILREMIVNAYKQGYYHSRQNKN